MQEKEGEGRETGRKIELLTGERGENHVEEPSCDNRPTSMHRCECHECTQVSPATLPHFKQINPILYRLYRSHPIFYSIFYSG